MARHSPISGHQPSDLGQIGPRAIMNSEVPPVSKDGARLLTAAQAAELCQISERQLRRMIHDGRIRVLRFGRSVRIRPADLGL